jgi:hypothetical protein
MRSEVAAYTGNFIGRRLANTSKQCMLRHDGKRGLNILIHGDFTNKVTIDSHAGFVYTYDPVADVVDGASDIGIAPLSQKCHGPGNVNSFEGNDGAAVGMDYLNDVLWTTPGSDFGATHGTACDLTGNSLCPSTAGSTAYSGLMYMHPTTGAWTGVSTHADGREDLMMNGYFDPVQRCLIGQSANEFICRIFVDVTPPTKSLTPINFTSLGVPFPGTGPTAGLMEAEIACDFVGRWGYYLVAGRPVPADPNPWVWYFMRFQLDNPTVQQRLADVPYFPPTYLHTLGSTHIRSVYWDSRNRRVVWFYRRTSGGARMVHGVGVYTPATDSWETIPIAQTPAVGLGAICGGTIGYDSTNNVFIGFGSAGDQGDDPMGQEGSFIPNYYWLWRYA